VITFLTVYLGLIAGRQPVEMRVDPSVAMVRILLDGQNADTLAAPPWRVIVNFGPTIQPHELVAVGLNQKGDEITRTTQFINLPRPTAELEIELDRDAKGVPKRATLSGFHVSYAEVRRATLKLDVIPLRLDRTFHTSLPPIDMKRPHVLSAEMKFADGTVARREVVFGGEFAESMPTQLTPTAVTRAGATDKPVGDDCFVSNGAPLRINGVEKPSATLIIVRDPDPTEISAALLFTAIFNGRVDTAALRTAAPLERDTTMELMSPAADRVVAPDKPTAILFPSFPNPDTKEGVYWFLTSTKIRGTTGDTPRRWADAVAVAAVKAVSSGRRRAVLLVLGNKPDNSFHSPATVRQYLAAIGVPLFVWSVFGRPGDPGWGEAEDVSTLEKLEAATEKIRGALDTQRIAWIYADPITALRADVREGCGYVRLAR